MAYTKLASTIVHSTVWAESDRTLRVWIGLLALADARGQIIMSRFSLRKIIEVPFEDLDAALDIFKSPDPHSRSTELEGRRILEIEGGWQLVNYAAYRCLDSQEQRRAKNAEYQRIHRQKKGLEKDDGVSKSKEKQSAKADRSDSQILSALSGHSDSDSDANLDSDPNPDPQANLQKNLSNTLANPDPECAREGKKVSAKSSKPGKQPAEKAESSSAVEGEAPCTAKTTEVEKVFPGEFCEESIDSPTLAPQEAADPPSPVAILIAPSFDSLPEPYRPDPRFDRWPDRAKVLDAAIMAYNQARPSSWLGTNPEDAQSQRRLEALHRSPLCQTSRDPDRELVELVAHATLAMRTSKLHCSPDFSSNYLGWLLSDFDRLAQWASKGRALAEAGGQVAADALQPRRIYRDLAGNECDRGKVLMAAINLDPATVGEVEKRWIIDNFGNDEAEVENLAYLLKKWGMQTC